LGSKRESLRVCPGRGWGVSKMYGPGGGWGFSMYGPGRYVQAGVDNEEFNYN